MELFSSNITKTRVVHFKKEKCDIYVGRPSIWQNIYTSINDRKTLALHVVSSKDEAIRKYEEYILSQPQLLAKLPELRGKIMGCWCGFADDWEPGVKMFCHAQVLQKLIRLQELGINLNSTDKEIKAKLRI